MRATYKSGDSAPLAPRHSTPPSPPSHPSYPHLTAPFDAHLEALDRVVGPVLERRPNDHAKVNEWAINENL